MESFKVTFDVFSPKDELLGETSLTLKAEDAVQALVLAEVALAADHDLAASYGEALGALDFVGGYVEEESN